MKGKSYIDGAWLDGSSGEAVVLCDPMDNRRTVSETAYVTPTEASDALASAHRAWSDWRREALAERLGLLAAVADAIEADGERFARCISDETGKTSVEADQETRACVLETRDQLRFFETGLRESSNGHEIAYEPLGAVLLITPSNFPLAAVMRKLVPTLLAGNTAVVKASELTPLTATLLFEIIARAGLPRGVANLVQARGSDVVPAMLEAPGLRAVSFTGATASGDSIASAIGGKDIRLQAEMGGSNAAVVLADADQDKAAKAIVAHGFACCGQWCTGTSRVIVAAEIYADFSARLLREMRQLSLGRDADIGALISAAQLVKIAAAVAALVDDGATLLAGGKRPDDPATAHGNFYEPTLLADVDDFAALSDQEIFGPVLVLQAADSIDAAVRLANAGQYGLSFSVFTRDAEVAESLVTRVDAGLCHINLPTGFRDNALPILGWQRSGRGVPECGRFARDFVTRTKAVYRG